MAAREGREETEFAGLLILMIWKPRVSCHVGNSYEGKQHWTRTVLECKTAWKLLVLLAWVQELMLLSGEWTVSFLDPSGPSLAVV